MLLGSNVSNVSNTHVAIYEVFGQIEVLPSVSLANSLVNAACIPLFRELTRIFDLKMLYIIAVVLVMVSAAVIGAALSIEVVIVGRAMLGIGGALSYQLILTYNVVFALPLELAFAQAMVGACFAIGLLTGRLIGGALTETPHATWRWAFYIVVMGAVPLVLVGNVVQQTFGLGTTAEPRILLLTVLTTRPVVSLVALYSICAAMSYGVTIYYTPLHFTSIRGETPV
ncbi:major facilitator superfamily domain-containing protein [Microdochium trichocladiopsis]|uniref:Major facilitator superfamily domain-containing protein n=1 Tax=Microdochium trichocladiopsis TaxID=1682393 RepID=A0A9P8XQP9_9PEZI|nr:major facilitator superfamily domain-containing protein [Microdochium trichocladiopsis]XP_046004610.1 major facilitator superfamily domain-containing protein [Microdochium trichocladiopsis]KAH7009142.1 major facilitator superfamily domain-containing protein [Microdochium trichocladiopsis]KAH7012234.1 major facilitator superfamily domain-containing protein [Microdochium trichocladiopsis]